MILKNYCLGPGDKVHNSAIDSSLSSIRPETIMLCIAIIYIHTMYLCQCICESHGKEEVSIGTAGMDPEVPENRTEDRREQKHHQNNQSVAEVWK